MEKNVSGIIVYYEYAGMLIYNDINFLRTDSYHINRCLSQYIKKVYAYKRKYIGEMY